MTRINSIRKNCRDVFNAFLVSESRYGGLFEFPVIKGTNQIPNRLIPFSKCSASGDYDQWVHFYEDDYLFEKIWRNPKRYLDVLKKYNGVILPDFSLYRDMPFVMQLWNIYRSRAIGSWLERNGVEVVVNIRFGDHRSYRICCDGLSQGGIVAIGTHGTLKNKEDRAILVEGLDIVVKIIKPKVIVVYGAAPEEIFENYRKQGIRIVQFESEFGKAMKRRKEVV